MLQDEVLSHNTSARIIWSNQSLVLQSVTRSSAGIYVCAAANALAETKSEALHFRVKCKFKAEKPISQMLLFISKFSLYHITDFVTTNFAS